MPSSCHLSKSCPHVSFQMICQVCSLQILGVSVLHLYMKHTGWFCSCLKKTAFWSSRLAVHMKSRVPAPALRILECYSASLSSDLVTRRGSTTRRPCPPLLSGHHAPTARRPVPRHHREEPFHFPRENEWAWAAPEAQRRVSRTDPEAKRTALPFFVLSPGV